MQYPSPAVSAFPRQLNTSVSLIESGAPLNETLDLARTFLRQNPNRLFITQTCAGRERIGEMQFCGIGFSNSGCYPPLGIARVRFSDFSLRQDENTTGRGKIQRRTQSGSTTSNDDEVRIDSLRCTAAVHALKMSQPSAGSNSETGFRLCRSGLDPKRHSSAFRTNRGFGLEQDTTLGTPIRRSSPICALAHIDRHQREPRSG